MYERKTLFPKSRPVSVLKRVALQTCPRERLKMKVKLARENSPLFLKTTPEAKRSSQFHQSRHYFKIGGRLVGEFLGGILVLSAAALTLTPSNMHMTH